ncbi:MAG: lipoprotein-releasing system ATP-binding protein LolD [Gammaproteobacteria bacterium]|nr:lipoprotein-releasing system ATP-binding protein LolD [Gammaproteobacteria bacterium]|tara:strand:- start:390 stop:1079 length:690 start_codon:yes stop_codon:yes gene_type:complete
MTQTYLEAVNLRKSFFKGDEEVKVLTGVNLKVRNSETLAIIGPSGTGKTTLLQIMGLLDQPSAGEIKIKGETLSTISDKQRSRLRNRFFGFVYQFHHLINEFSALENTMMPLLVRRESISQAREAAREVLAEIGLSNRLHHKPSELSGGECQRVAVARALIGKPSVVLADEPTGNLDPGTAEKVFDSLLELNRSIGSSLIIVTHNHVLADSLDRQVFLDQGRVKEQQSS